MEAKGSGLVTCRMRAGFSIIELLVVMVIGVLLMTMGMNKYRKFETYQSIDNASNALVLLARRARSVAIEKGTTVQLDIDQDQKRAWVSSGGTTLDQIYFSEQGVATMENSNGARITVCYNSRGFALTSTCTTSGLPMTVRFGRSGQTGTVLVQPLGQIVKS